LYFRLGQSGGKQRAAANLPVWLGLLDVWNSTFLNLPSRCVAPYHHGLRRLPAYLQQLEMESNGKRVDTQGQPCPGRAPRLCRGRGLGHQQL
jgi:glucose-6-phosphate isomerase